MRFVPVKSAEQLAVQAVHRIRSRLVADRVRLVNQVRGLLGEHGIVVTTPAPVIVRADDDNNAPFENGGIGLVIVESALSTDQVNVQPLRFNSKPA